LRRPQKLRKDRSLFIGAYLYGKAFSAFGPSSVKHVRSAGRTHPCQKPVGLFSFSLVWLECSFAHFSILRIYGLL